MKQKLLTLILTLFITSTLISQTLTANQIDDFEDGTTLGWKHANANPNSPVNIVTDGPAGVNDNFLRNSNSGTTGAGSRHIYFNRDSRWKGDFDNQEIVAIRMDIRNTGINDLHLRVAIRGGVGPTWMATSAAVIVTAGSNWSTIEVPILESDFVVTDAGGDTPETILSTHHLVSGEIRILSNDGLVDALHLGDKRVQISDYDNITASTTLLSIKEQEPQNTFSISPNPGSTRLNVELSRLDDNITMEVFDVLGKKVYEERLNSLSKSINVFKWNSGVYLVRITSDHGTQTKRFVKQ